MAESFRKIVNLPPLRVTVQQVAERADELVAQMNCGAKLTPGTPSRSKTAQALSVVPRATFSPISIVRASA